MVIFLMHVFLFNALWF